MKKKSKTKYWAHFVEVSALNSNFIIVSHLVDQYTDKLKGEGKVGIPDGTEQQFDFNYRMEIKWELILFITSNRDLHNTDTSFGY